MASLFQGPLQLKLADESPTQCSRFCLTPNGKSLSRPRLPLAPNLAAGGVTRRGHVSIRAAAQSGRQESVLSGVDELPDGSVVLHFVPEDSPDGDTPETEKQLVSFLTKPVEGQKKRKVPSEVLEQVLGSHYHGYGDPAYGFKSFVKGVLSPAPVKPPQRPNTPPPAPLQPQRTPPPPSVAPPEALPRVAAPVAQASATADVAVAAPVAQASASADVAVAARVAQASASADVAPSPVTGHEHSPKESVRPSAPSPSLTEQQGVAYAASAAPVPAAPGSSVLAAPPPTLKPVEEPQEQAPEITRSQVRTSQAVAARQGVDTVRVIAVAIVSAITSVIIRAVASLNSSATSFQPLASNIGALATFAAVSVFFWVTGFARAPPDEATA